MTTAVASAGVRIGPVGVPEPGRTLGWRVLEWCAEYLQLPDGPRAGEPWMFTREQARFVLWWYAIDERGRFIYRRGMLRRMKGWGKDPVGAALCCVEFVGPCRFGGFDDDGMPIVIEHPAAWVQTAAVSKDQTRNTTTLLPGMISPWAIEEYSIDMGKEILYAHQGKCRLEVVTSSPRALEGGRPTFILKNETHHWIQSNEGHAMSAVIDRNAAKSRDGSTRVLSISNAHNPGEDSDAERDYEAWVAIETGKSRATGFLYDSLEAPPDVELVPVATGEGGELTAADFARARESLWQGLLAARGDSEWLDVERLIEEIYDPKTAVSTSRRFYLNQIVAAEDAWLTPQEWDTMARPGETVADGELITLGLDGSKTSDHTVLAGCRVSDGYRWLIKAWDPADSPLREIDLDRVEDEVRAAFGKWDVVGFFSDRFPFSPYNAKWERDFGEQLCARASALRPVEWDMSNSKAAAYAAQAYHDAIVEGMAPHSGDKELAQYHYNARRRPTMYGTAEEPVVTFGKESQFSSRKVDGVAACVLAWQARTDYLALPESKKRQKKRKLEVFWT